MQNSFYKITVQAGVPYIAPYAGQYFALDDCGVNRAVDVQLAYQNQNYNNMPSRVNGFQIQQQFDQIIFNAAVTTVVQFFASATKLTLGVKDGSQVSVPGGVAITNTSPIAVNFAGTVAPVLGNVNVTNTNLPVTTYQAQTVNDRAQISVAQTIGVLAAALSTRRGIRIKNVGANPVAIGGSSLTFATAAIVLQIGDVWNEDEAPAAAWYCVCGTGLTSTLNIQDII